jgi:hypothetical protein
MWKQPAMQPRADHEVWLRWRGRESVRALQSLLEHTDRIVIALPADYNHALYSLLDEEDSTDDAEEIEASGGVDLLRRIASIRGLQELHRLADTMEPKILSVQVHSPPSIVLEQSS